MDKKQSRLRRAARARAKIRELGAHRLCVHRSPRHIYAQVISPDGDRVIASASTLDKEYRQGAEGHSGNVAAAAVVGRIVA
jgi:large subunit ribosomal protein L18